MYLKNLLFSVFLFFLIPRLSFANSDSTEIKISKIDYAEFIAKYSINDTSTTVINIFFDKSSNSAMGQMSIFPLTAAIYPLSPFISVSLSLVSLPIFVNGTVILIKYRKKKLYKVLVHYSETYELPKWLRKKVNKSLEKGQYDYD